MTQQGDVTLRHTLDGAAIQVAGGVVAMDGGLGTAVYLSLFGGNEDDPGLAGDATRTWWGNLDEPGPVRQYRSQLQGLRSTLPLTTGSMRRIEDAARADLAWLLSEDIASAVAVESTISARNRVDLIVSIEAFGAAHEFNFSENWSAST